MPRRRSFERLRKQLIAKLERLLADLAAGLAESQSGELYRAMDSPEMAAQSSDNAMVFRIVEMESEELEEIEEALRRIESGTYGKCEACGKAIGKNRLEAIPSASLCIDCKAAAEAGELDFGHIHGGDWEMVAEFEHASSRGTQVALDRGAKVS